MRCMVIVKANKDSEAGVLPNTEILTAMGKFNEELVKAGVMLAGDGLHPSSKGVRVRFSGREKTVRSGPFPETKELIALAKLKLVAMETRGNTVWRRTFGVTGDGDTMDLDLAQIAPSPKSEIQHFKRVTDTDAAR